MPVVILSRTVRLRAALLAAALLLPAVGAAAQTTRPDCAPQATDRLRSLGVDPATLSGAQTVPVLGSVNTVPSQYQVWVNSNACAGGYLVIVRTDCVPIGVEGGRGQCAIPRR
jgi:hypothetical protein